MPEPASILYGTELVTRADATSRVLQQLLDRLPVSLWNTSPDDPTPQRELFYAFAVQMALWLEQRTIARKMTLLLEAEGLDLDRLLQDYQLKRYLQRPDAFARQVGMHLLWMPTGTTHAVQVLSDLLFDLPHQVFRTGRSEVHVFVADTHPVVTPYSYWGLISTEGDWYAVTIHKGLPTISQIPPPGLNVAPGPQMLHWFTVHDENQGVWYVTVDGDTLFLSQTPPAWGTGTTEPFRVLDGENGLWELRANSADETLNPLPVTGSEPYAYWRVQSLDAGLYYVYVDNKVLTLDMSAPDGRDETPTLDDLDWFTVWDEDGTPWYVTIEGAMFQLTRLEPAGDGTDVPFRVLDGDGAWWGLQVDGEILETMLLTPSGTALTVINPGHQYETFQLIDEDDQPWWFSIEGETVLYDTLAPMGATDVTPAGGPYRWLRLYDLAGQRWYGYPLASGQFVTSLTSPGGLGTAPPQTLGDAQGVQWHYGVSRTEGLGTSNTPRRDFEGLSTALVMNDPEGKRWFWRIQRIGEEAWFEVEDVCWPDSIAQSPWGEIGWLRLLRDDGAVRYLFPTANDGSPTLLQAPPEQSPWGWSEPITLYDRHGIPWTLTIRGDDVLGYVQGEVEDIPQRPPLLSMRDIKEAYQHVTAAGSLVTVTIT